MIRILFYNIRKRGVCCKMSKFLQRSSLYRKKRMGLLLALTMILSLFAFVSTAEAASTISLSLGGPSVSSNTVTFPSAEIGGNATYYAMTVSVDKGSILSTDYSMADMLANHQTATWLFNSGKSTADVQTLLRSVKLSAQDGMTVTVTLTANQTSIPTSSYITAEEINGSTHYYIFVDSQISWENAYEVAKSYSFCGLKGYLATVTSADEDKILDAISSKRGWAGAARISTAWTDAELDQTCNGSVYSPLVGTKTANNSGTIWKWVCGPEAGLSIKIDGSQALRYYGVQNGTGYSNWSSGEPNGSNTSSLPELFLEVHFPSEYRWNDIPANWTQGGRGYFVEFSPYDGGYVSGYSEDNNVTASQLVHVHSLTKTEAVAPTCTDKGNNEYYTCSVCSKVFKDSEGKTETTVEAETLPAKGHSLTKTEAVDPTCTEEGNNEYYTCSVCGRSSKMKLPQKKPPSRLRPSRLSVMTGANGSRPSLLSPVLKGSKPEPVPGMLLTRKPESSKPCPTPFWKGINRPMF